MTDSGFSSAASQRSASSIVRPIHINSFSSSLKPDLLFSIPSDNEDGENNQQEESLPKPCMQFPGSCGRPLIPNRLIYGKNHGGYSPGLSPFSKPEMSPMSSLTYDFKDLNTSHSSSATPRKRLSLSSVSSLDSPHTSGPTFQRCSGPSHASPAMTFITPSINSSSEQTAVIDDACFFDTPTPATAQDDRDLHSGGQARTASHGHANEDRGPIFRRFKSMPATKARFRRLGTKQTTEQYIADKENEGQSPGVFSRHQVSASPIGLSDNVSPIGNAKAVFRPRNRGPCSKMSSPLVGSFSHGKSSAFKPISPAEVARKGQRRVLGDIDANALQPGLSPDRATKLGGIKRLLEESGNASVVIVARKKKCSKSLNAKTAFLQERKTKSADAIMPGRPLPSFANEASPIAKRNFVYRPISAPLLVDDDDDDYVLSHSRLCSQDSDDEEFRKSSSDDGFASVSSCKEDEIENMITENIKECVVSDADQISTVAPAALDGLMSGALLLGNDDNDSKESDCIAELVCENNDELKPRELFRSPSAPPLVPSRRALMKLKRAARNAGCQLSNESTPVSIKRQRTFASLSEAQTECMVPSPSLNRSLSDNQLGVMQAVDQGCEDSNLVGDFSRECTLRTVVGRKQDLKYIAPQTLVEALNNQHNVGMVEVIDCRYPYEFEGGHVGGAVNVWTEEQLIQRYFTCAKPMWAKAKQQQAQTGEIRPHVLVFHCEFSSERAPKLARYMRNYDRSQNDYPELYYPEIYVLKDGYKEFFNVRKDYCEPRNYVQMSNGAYAGELRKFRTKSKTWAGERSKLGLFNRLKHR